MEARYFCGMGAMDIFHMNTNQHLTQVAIKSVTIFSLDQEASSHMLMSICKCEILHILIQTIDHLYGKLYGKLYP